MVSMLWERYNAFMYLKIAGSSKIVSTQADKTGSQEPSTHPDCRTFLFMFINLCLCNVEFCNLDFFIIIIIIILNKQSNTDRQTRGKKICARKMQLQQLC